MHIFKCKQISDMLQLSNYSTETPGLQLLGYTPYTNLPVK